MTTNKQLETRVKELENQLAEVQPMIDIFKNGKIIGHAVVIALGAIAGAATIWLAFGSFIMAHIK